MDPMLSPDVLKTVTSPITIATIGVLSGGVVRVLRTKKAQKVLDALPFTRAIPKRFLPWTALIWGVVLAFLDAKLNAGLGWKESAVLSAVGLISGAFAVGGHETIGKLVGLFMYTPKGPLTPPTESSKPPPPNGVARFAMACVASVLVLILAFSLASCTKQDAHSAIDDVLTPAQLICIETGDGSLLVNDDAVAAVCKIARSSIFRSLLHALIGQREAANRSGYRWPVADAGDAGTEAGR